MRTYLTLFATLTAACAHAQDVTVLECDQPAECRVEACAPSDQTFSVTVSAADNTAILAFNDYSTSYDQIDWAENVDASRWIAVHGIEGAERPAFLVLERNGPPLVASADIEILPPSWINRTRAIQEAS